MHAIQSPRQGPCEGPRRALRAFTATLAALALTAGLVATTPAGAVPKVESDNSDPTLPTLPNRGVVDLGRGATDVQVQESTHGGTVAVLWQTNGGTQVWARVKNRGSWGTKVRMSPPKATASRPSMDIDSDGSLLVGWSERRGTRTSVVARRLTGNKPGPRRVFGANATDGPYVGAGPFQDMIAWTARSNEKNRPNRPFVSVNAGAGFTSPTRIGGKSWPYETFHQTLAVNSDGPQAHLVHVTRDTDKRVARSSWAVLDPARAKGWRTVNDVGARQRYDKDAPRRPVITFHRNSRVVIIFTNEQMAENVDLPEQPQQIPQVRDRWPSGVTWTSRSGAPKNSFTAPKHIQNPHAWPLPDEVTHLRNIRGSVVAAHTGDMPQLNVLMRPNATSFTQEGTNIGGACRPFPEWFLPSLPGQGEVPYLLCVDNDADRTAQIFPDLAENPIRKFLPDPKLGGSVRATAPNPLVPVLVVTEDLPGANDPVWFHDLTTGGTDQTLPKEKFVRTKAGRVKGRARVGKKLTAVTGQWSPTPIRVRYRWFVGNKLRPKATKRTFKVRKGMRGKRIKVQVTVIRDGYRNRSVTMKAKGKVTPKR